jgi:hypothetical protein
LRVVANVPRQLPSPPAIAPERVRTVLHRWCLAGATGALRILDPPGGTVFILDGRITHAECPFTNGLTDLLTAADRVAPDAWSAAMAAGGPDHRVGDVLVERGDITGAELEVQARAALFSAALYQLPVGAPTDFETGVRHPVGTVRAVEFDHLCAEVDRRRALLSEAWPDETLDTTAVRLVRRLPGHHIALTSTQWAIIANADQLLSPLELARAMAEDTFAVLLEARRMARAGLIEVTATAPAGGSPRPGKEARPLPRRRGVARPVTRHRLDDPAVPVATLLRIRRGLEERL